MALVYAELLAALSFRLTTFPDNQGCGELVPTRAIPFLDPVRASHVALLRVAHVGYLPGERILGLSKLARPVERFVARPQTHRSG